MSEVVNTQRTLFTFFHVGETRRQVVESGALEAALWFMNEAPRVFRAPRQSWLDLIRGNLPEGVTFRSVDEPAAFRGEMDLDDPVPVIRLMNRMEAGLDETLSPASM